MSLFAASMASPPDQNVAFNPNIQMFDETDQDAAPVYSDVATSVPASTGLTPEKGKASVQKKRSGTNEQFVKKPKEEHLTWEMMLRSHHGEPRIALEKVADAVLHTGRDAPDGVMRHMRNDGQLVSVDIGDLLWTKEFLQKVTSDDADERLCEVYKTVQTRLLLSQPAQILVWEQPGVLSTVSLILVLFYSYLRSEGASDEGQARLLGHSHDVRVVDHAED